MEAIEGFFYYSRAQTPGKLFTWGARDGNPAIAIGAAQTYLEGLANKLRGQSNAHKRQETHDLMFDHLFHFSGGQMTKIWDNPNPIQNKTKRTNATANNNNAKVRTFQTQDGEVYMDEATDTNGTKMTQEEIQKLGVTYKEEYKALDAEFEQAKKLVKEKEFARGAPLKKLYDLLPPKKKQIRMDGKVVTIVCRPSKVEGKEDLYFLRGENEDEDILSL